MPRFPLRQIRRDALKHLRGQNPPHAVGRLSPRRLDGVDEFRIGQNRRRAEQPESIGASGGGEIQRARTRTDEEIGKSQQRGGFDQAKIAGIDGGRAGTRSDKFLRARDVRQRRRPERRCRRRGGAAWQTNSAQVSSGQSLSGCEAPMPSTIQGRAQDLNFSPTGRERCAGRRKSGSVDGSGTFIAAIRRAANRSA